MPLIKSSCENPGGFSLGILLLIRPCKPSYKSPITWSDLLSHSVLLIVYLPSILGPTNASIVSALANFLAP